MITIFPALSISIRAICTPAAVTAFTALVTSCCRNVEGARAISPLLHQQIERACERPRVRAVAVGGDRLAQDVYWAAMLYQLGGRDRRGMGVHVKRPPALGGVQEYFTNAAVGEAANPGRISAPVVLDVRELVSTAV